MDAFKSKLFHDYNKNNVPVNSSDMLGKAFSKYVKWPIPPKVKETHFKICHKIYPVSNFLHKRFKFDKAGCAFCGFTDESLEHLFFTCPISCRFWSDVRYWLTLKMSNNCIQHLADAFCPNSGNIYIFISMCVFWESNPQTLRC